jgi:hypothetical protein
MEGLQLNSNPWSSTSSKVFLFKDGFEPFFNKDAFFDLLLEVNEKQYKVHQVYFFFFVRHISTLFDAFLFFILFVLFIFTLFLILFY